jgi:AcrR family transcriptional regulator
VLHVALELFAENGFAGTSTREISERLGFTKAALYYHFHTKDDILLALVRPVLEQIDALVDSVSANPSRTARRDLVAAYIQLAARNHDLINTLGRDPSASKRAALAPAKPVFERLILLLADSAEPTVFERTRVRAALGGINAALLGADPTDPVEEIQQAALTAACGALGITGPRQGGS